MFFLLLKVQLSETERYIEKSDVRPIRLQFAFEGKVCGTFGCG